MAPVDLLRYLKLGELTVEQKAKLKKALSTRIRVLQAATKKLDQSLTALARKRKKKTAKQRAAKRKR